VRAVLVGMLGRRSADARRILVTRMKAFDLLVCVVGLTAACGALSESEPSFAYQYVVRGSGENVMVTYLTQLEGLVYETVTLPWTSAEFEGPDEFIRIEADGPAGTRVKCSVRYRRIEGTYGGNGSGTSSQWANRPDEDQTRCALDLVQIP
jgi:hypothetical protein